MKRDDALTGAAVSAAVGLALYGLRKALAGARDERPSARSAERALPVPAIWEARAEALLPLAEQAAAAAGTWVARNAPAVARERLLPRFIESFEGTSAS